MIGQLTFWVSTKRHTATLDDDLTWKCDEPEVEDYLQKTFTIHTAEGLSNLAVGRHALYQTAERVGGSVNVPMRRKPQSPPKPELV